MKCTIPLFSCKNVKQRARFVVYLYEDEKLCDVSLLFNNDDNDNNNNKMPNKLINTIFA